MTKATIVLALALLIPAPFAGAQQPVSADKPLVGKVARIYYKEAHGVFIESRLLRHPGNRERWTEVELRSPEAARPVTELVRIPEGLRVATGDVVETVIMQREEFLIAPMPEVSRVVKMLAPANSLLAEMLFEGVAPRRSPALRLTLSAFDPS